MQKKSLLVLILSASLITLIPIKSFAFQIIFEKQFVRLTASPVSEKYTFLANNDVAKIEVINGGNTESIFKKVSSAKILINENMIISQNEFNQNVDKLEKQIGMKKGENTISVITSGIPGSSITIRVSQNSTSGFIIPQKTIAIDGNYDDWGIESRIYEDLDGPECGNISGRDIKEVYLAQDDNYLYLRFVINGPLDPSFGYKFGEDLHISVGIINGDPYVAYRTPTSSYDAGYDFPKENLPSNFVHIDGNQFECKVYKYYLRRWQNKDLAAWCDQGFTTVCRDYIRLPKIATLLLEKLHYNSPAIIGPQGGIVTVSDSLNSLYGTSIEIPPGALLTSAQIKISKPSTPPPIPENANLISQISLLEPSGQIFLLPVTVVLKYNELLCQNENNLFIYTFNGSLWEPTYFKRRNTESDVITSLTSHFSSFAVFEAKSTLSSTYSPNNNSFCITNTGGSGGWCYGMSAYSKWYYENIKDCKLIQAYDCNIRERDVASDAHQMINAVSNLNCSFPATNHKDVANQLIANLSITGPQVLVIRDKDRVGPCHAVLVYSFNPNTNQFYYYDPNIGGHAQILTYANNQLSDYYQGGRVDDYIISSHNVSDMKYIFDNSGYDDRNDIVTIGKNTIFTTANMNQGDFASTVVNLGPYKNDTKTAFAGINFNVIKSNDCKTISDAKISVLVEYHTKVNLNVIDPSQEGGGSADAHVYVWIGNYKIEIIDAAISFIHYSGSDEKSNVATISHRVAGSPTWTPLQDNNSFEVKVEVYAHAQVYKDYNASALAEAKIIMVEVSFDEE